MSDALSLSLSMRNPRCLRGLSTERLRSVENIPDRMWAIAMLAPARALAVALDLAEAAVRSAWAPAYPDDGRPLAAIAAARSGSAEDARRASASARRALRAVARVGGAGGDYSVAAYAAACAAVYAADAVGYGVGGYAYAGATDDAACVASAISYAITAGVDAGGAAEAALLD